ncbi:MAG TPA: hypothetical protein VGG74_21200 [Kofleriaceae bacterium]|jgi:hypothetical protein
MPHPPPPEGTRFKPGESGNPTGRPSFSRALKMHGLTSAATLEEVIGVARKMLTSVDHKERIFAVQWFTDRILGKATTPIRVSGVMTNLNQVALAAMSDDEIRRQLADAEAESLEEDSDDDGEATSGDAPG